MEEEDFRVVKIEAELILEANRLQLMKQDLEKAENAYLSSFTSKKSKTLPGATAAAHGDQMARMITKRKVNWYRQLDGLYDSGQPTTAEHLDVRPASLSLNSIAEKYWSTNGIGNIVVCGTEVTFTYAINHQRDEFVHESDEGLDAFHVLGCRNQHKKSSKIVPRVFSS
ncbi:hypothetical protein TNCV_1583291 [Trichonephila clavipes]|nr:hypothetical protein TNCV_1583291 [Trichonephila clavipes]